MADQALYLWLHGVRIARLSGNRPFRLRLDFTSEAIKRFGEGSRVLSLALPVSATPVVDVPKVGAPKPVSAFIEGLLPEGQVRQHIATLARIPVTDVMGLLRSVGAECAGAVQILPADRVPSGGNVRQLDADEVAAIVADLPTYHLPQGATPQASLAGVQDKVLLSALGDGGWGWPEGGAASTHIIKPEPLSHSIVANLIQAEDWALRLARLAGLSAAESRLEEFGGRLAIVVTRYDRDGGGVRLHQEDFCQALGLSPEAKYESTAEASSRRSRLSRVANAAGVRSVDPFEFRRSLLEALTFNVAIGNGDAHSKNYSLMIDPVGRVSLAPLYDAAPTWHLNPRYSSTSHVVNGKTSLAAVDVDDLAAEAAGWGMSHKRAKSIVVECLQHIWAALGAVDTPPELDDVRASIRAMWQKRSWPT